MHFVRLILLTAAFFLAGCSGPSHRSPLTVTYVANDGFLVESGGKKILIDALFGGFEGDWCFLPSDSVIELMRQALPPFDNVDIIAVTHYHVDHVNAGIVADNLIHNRSGILVCPPPVEQALSKLPQYPEIRDRIRALSIPVDSTMSTRIAGVDMKIMRSPHSAYMETDTVTGESIDRHRQVEQLEYLFTVGGRTIYHCGDASLGLRSRYERFGFGAASIDLAFVQWWDAKEKPSTRQVLVRDIIRPRRVILMHMFPNRPPIDNPQWQQLVAPEVIVPTKSMDKWTFQ